MLRFHICCCWDWSFVWTSHVFHGFLQELFFKRGHTQTWGFASKSQGNPCRIVWVSPSLLNTVSVKTHGIRVIQTELQSAALRSSRECEVDAGQKDLCSCRELFYRFILVNYFWFISNYFQWMNVRQCAQFLPQFPPVVLRISHVTSKLQSLGQSAMPSGERSDMSVSKST